MGVGGLLKFDTNGPDVGVGTNGGGVGVGTVLLNETRVGGGVGSSSSVGVGVGIEAIKGSAWLDICEAVLGGDFSSPVSCG